MYILVFTAYLIIYTCPSNTLDDRNLVYVINGSTYALPELWNVPGVLQNSKYAKDQTVDKLSYWIPETVELTIQDVNFDTLSYIRFNITDTSSMESILMHKNIKNSYLFANLGQYNVDIRENSSQLLLVSPNDQNMVYLAHGRFYPSSSQLTTCFSKSGSLFSLSTALQTMSNGNTVVYDEVFYDRYEVLISLSGLGIRFVNGIRVTNPTTSFTFTLRYATWGSWCDNKNYNSPANLTFNADGTFRDLPVFMADCISLTFPKLMSTVRVELTAPAEDFVFGDALQIWGWFGPESLLTTTQALTSTDSQSTMETTEQSTTNKRSTVNEITTETTSQPTTTTTPDVTMETTQRSTTTTETTSQPTTTTTPEVTMKTTQRSTTNDKTTETTSQSTTTTTTPEVTMETTQRSTTNDKTTETSQPTTTTTPEVTRETMQQSTKNDKTTVTTSQATTTTTTTPEVTTETTQRSITNDKTTETTSQPTTTTTTPEVNTETTQQSTITETTTESFITMETSTIENGYCHCQCELPQYSNTSMEEILKAMKQITDSLSVNKSELSSTIRQKTCADDNRPSARGVGYVGCGVLTTVLVLMLIVDLQTLCTYIRSPS